MKHINRNKAKKVSLPLYWVGHVIVNIFGGTYTRYYRDEDNNLTFVIDRDKAEWQRIFPSANVIDKKGCNVVWVIFKKNTRHWYYTKREECI
jgi:hypothetical protein